MKWSNYFFFKYATHINVYVCRTNNLSNVAYSAHVFRRHVWLTKCWNNMPSVWCSSAVRLCWWQNVRVWGYGLTLTSSDVVYDNQPGNTFCAYCG